MTKYCQPCHKPREIKGVPLEAVRWIKSSYSEKVSRNKVEVVKLKCGHEKILRVLAA